MHLRLERALPPQGTVVHALPDVEVNRIRRRFHAALQRVQAGIDLEQPDMAYLLPQLVRELVVARGTPIVRCGAMPQ
ncbi:hypothetical protein KQH60_10610 [Mycetohabitans sp. B8]|uniref:hypothetical protein n=1 Tax=Mycetohabitans sp. B8 TaxID=2841845 RepID=UPI001F439DC2|nr:hypothetical protein [Mycetohabitans sp. B8]MCG1042958.1 hypothetical protein [Mycetohabitans sp. B8]